MHTISYVHTYIMYIYTLIHNYVYYCTRNTEAQAVKIIISINNTQCLLGADSLLGAHFRLVEIQADTPNNVYYISVHTRSYSPIGGI